MAYRRDLRERHAAYHEAGHAVAAVIECAVAKLDRVTIISSGRGNVGTTHWSGEATVGSLAAHMMILHAGPEAERRAFPHCNPGSSQDYTDAYCLFYSRHEAIGIDLDDDAVAGAFKQAQDYAAHVVEYEWAAIEEVARALLERKTLAGHEVAEIVRRIGRERRKLAAA